MARRHRILTVPSGLLLFACIALPGYRDCGNNVAMRQDPYLAAACIVGLCVAVAAVVFANRRGELGIAVASAVLASFALVTFAVGLVFVRPVYAGVTMGGATALGVLVGIAAWLHEVRGSNVGITLVVTGPLLIVLLLVSAVCSTWEPPPVVPSPDLGPLLVH